ncbi:CelD/BcsL family acetyltransferase involved in cellulose biosynthesis [Paraburkholderia sp. GAS199]|uniref:GNAT family N-acetyltransferase n=1 Tax=Paraburkholderia sp. GAS199 TaxID=3035126 RepID=UPI003D26341C
MKAEAVEFQIVEDIDAMQALQPEWDALWHTAHGECYQSFRFCMASWTTGVAAPGGKLHCVAGRKSGRLVALLPFVIHRNLLWKFVKPLAPDNGSPNGVLVEPGPDAVDLFNATWRAMLKSTRADVVELRRVRAGSLLHLNAVANGRIVNASQELTPFVPLRQYTDWDEFRRSCGGRSNTSPEYLARRLSNRGKVEVEIVEANDDRAEHFVDWLLTHKREWARRNDLNSPSIFAPQTRDFLLAQLKAPPGHALPFRFFVLTLNGHPLAIALAAIAGHCFDLFMNTYDAAYSKLSPGTALVDYCVKWAFDHRLDFDFGPGLQQYKCFWSRGESYETVNVRLAQTAWGLAGCKIKATLGATRDAVRRLRSEQNEKNEDAPQASGETPQTPLQV